MLLTPERTVAPASEPITLAEAKLHLNIAEDDSTYNSEINGLIQAAREQWEHDTDSAVISQTFRIRVAVMQDGLFLPKRPITAIATLKYYDASDALQTLSTTVYSLDTANRTIRLNRLQVWPVTSLRWDAWEITYVCGYANAAAVPAIAKRAMLMLIAYYHDANRGDNDRPNDLRHYEKLVARYMRDTYP